ncbi:MAG: hypothetical protein HZB87_01305, partial [Desulfatitalea sp.]|nr:hypothetical protein [Desulfatitalea sp.]
MDKTVRTLVIAFAIIGLGLLGYYWTGRWHTHGIETATQKEKEICQQRMAQLESENQRLNAELAPLAQQYKSDLAHAFGLEKGAGAAQS